jgi:hypothetical protein
MNPFVMLSPTATTAAGSDATSTLISSRKNHDVVVDATASSRTAVASPRAR